MIETIRFVANTGSIFYFYNEGCNHTLDSLLHMYNNDDIFGLTILHRIDGPATQWKSDFINDDWVIMGKQVPKSKYLEWLNEMGMDIKNLTTEDETLIILKWGP